MNKDIIEVIKSKKLLNSLGPSNMKKIEKAEETLGLKFSEEYIKYLLEFGAVTYYGAELSGLVTEEDEEKGFYFSVVDATLEEKEYDDTVPENMYIVEDLGVDGALAWQDETGAVYYKYRFDDNLQKAADSLAEYLEIEELDEEDLEIIEELMAEGSYTTFDDEDID